MDVHGLYNVGRGRDKVPRGICVVEMRRLNSERSLEGAPCLANVLWYVGHAPVILEIVAHLDPREDPLAEIRTILASVVNRGNTRFDCNNLLVVLIGIFFSLEPVFDYHRDK